MKGQLKKNMDYKNMKSKRILAGMLALLLASGTAPVNFGSALTTGAAIAEGIGPKNAKPGTDHSDRNEKAETSEDITSSDETETVTADEDNTASESVNDSNNGSNTNDTEATDSETTDQETADEETTDAETTDAETTDEETTDDESVIIITPDIDIPIGAEIFINSDDHFFDGKTSLRIGNVISADRAKLDYDSYDLQCGYKFMFNAPNSSGSFTIGIANEDGSLTPLGLVCVSGSGTKNDPYMFEAVYKKEEKKRNAGSFVTVDSIKEAVEKMTDVSPEDAKAWLAANADAIKAAEPDYHGTYDLFFMYKGDYYCKTIAYNNLNADYITAHNFKWDHINEKSYKSIMYQCLGQKEHILVWGNADEQAPVTYIKTEAKEPTCTEAGNSEYYKGPDNKYYKLENGVYTEIVENSWVIEAKGHSYGQPEWIWNDDLTASAKIVCEECGDIVYFEADVTSKVIAEPTYATDGKIMYIAAILFEDNVYSCTMTVSVPKHELTYVEAVAPSCTEGGSIGYWYDASNDRYFTDENGENEITKAETFVEAVGHTMGNKVIENYVKPTYLSDGGYDEVYYCVVCGEELFREHIALSKLKYKAPALTYTKAINAVNLSWAPVEDAERYGIAGYVNGKWQLLYNCEDTSFVLNGLTEGREYWIAVIPKCNGKWITDFSNAIVVSSQSTVGRYPILSSVEHNEETHQFRLRWSAVKGAQQYGVAVYLSGKWQIVKQDIPAGTTYFTSPKLTAGQTYRMVICAKINGKWDTSNINARSFSVTVQPEASVNHGNYEADDFVFSGNVYIVGDSTVCNYKPETTESKGSCGWGMKLGEQFEGVNVTNLARAGRSSRSFMNDPEYKILCDSIGKGDYLFIQFGHNDERTAEPQHAAYPYLEFSTLDGEGKNPNGQYSYEWMLLNKYVRVAQEKGATAVLVTPVSRRAKDGTAMIEEHKQYSDAVVALGKKYNIPVIDMTTKTAELYNKLYEEGGEEATAELHCYLDETRTTIDNTHLSVKGCELIADILAEETKTLGLKISERLI